VNAQSQLHHLRVAIHRTPPGSKLVKHKHSDGSFVLPEPSIRKFFWNMIGKHFLPPSRFVLSLLSWDVQRLQTLAIKTKSTAQAKP
jgi:hypothetical protein